MNEIESSIINAERDFCLVEDIFKNTYFLRFVKKYFKDTKTQNNGRLIVDRKITPYYAYLLDNIFWEERKFLDFMSFLRDEHLVDGMYEKLHEIFSREEIMSTLLSFSDLHYRVLKDSWDRLLPVDIQISNFQDAILKRTGEVVSAASETYQEISNTNQKQSLDELLERWAMPISNRWDILWYISGSANGYDVATFISWETMKVDKLGNNLNPWYEVVDIVWTELTREQQIERRNLLELYHKFHFEVPGEYHKDDVYEYQELYSVWLEGIEDYNPQEWVHISQQENPVWHQEFGIYLEVSMKKLDRQIMRADLTVI